MSVRELALFSVRKKFQVFLKMPLFCKTVVIPGMVLYNHRKGKPEGARAPQGEVPDNNKRSRGLPPGTIRNPNGRDTRSDKKIGTIRKENGTKSGK